MNAEIRNINLLWRDAVEGAPDPGVFVELSRDGATAFESGYWIPGHHRVDGLRWRLAPAPNFNSVDTMPVEPIPVDEDFWYVVLLLPQQEIQTMWRVHETRRELFVPIIRRRVPTGRTGKNGVKTTRLIPKAMFPGYGMIRAGGILDVDALKEIRGVREVLRDRLEPVLLPHEAVMAIFRKQSQKHLEFIQQATGRKHEFKPRDKVRVASEDNVYDGMLAEVDKLSGADRIEVLLGVAKLRHSLPADMVVPA